MRYYYITFRSVTFAQRGERVLKNAGMRCGIQRTPKWMEEQGCGYSLKVQTGDIFGVIALLRQEELPLRKIYVQRADGHLEEIVV